MICSELESYFPDYFSNAPSTAFFSKIKTQTLKLLKAIAEGRDTDPIIAETDRYFGSLVRPKKLTGKYTDEIRYEHSYEANCIALAKFINQPVKTLTTKEYFALLEQVNEQERKSGRRTH